MQACGTLAVLPFEVCSQLVSFLEVGDILSFGFTSKRSLQICSPANNDLWVPVAQRLVLGCLEPADLQSVERTSAATEKLCQHLRGLAIASSDHTPAVGGMASSMGEALQVLPDPLVRVVCACGSVAIAVDFSSLLQRCLAQITSEAMQQQQQKHKWMPQQSNWLRHVVLRLHAYGFEYLSSQVKVLERVCRSHDDAKRKLVLEDMLRFFAQFRVMRGTQVCDIEAVHEVVDTIGDVMQDAVEQLKPIYKQMTCSRQREKGMLLNLRREFTSFSNALAVAAQLSAISDHPGAQAKYDSLWAAYRGGRTSSSDGAGDRAQEQAPCSACDDDKGFLMVPLIVKHYACLTRAQVQRLTRIDSVTVSDLVDYFVRMSKVEQQSFVANVRSVYILTLGDQWSE